MKKLIAILLIVQIVIAISSRLFSQSVPVTYEFGISTGGFTNFPANKNYLKEDISVFYLAPYLLAGKHEFSAGFVFPLKTHGLFFNDNKIDSRLGAIAGYKLYLFNVNGQENLFVHYSFQYLRFVGNFDISYSGSDQPYHWNETDMYINNVIGLGYNLFFDNNEKFGFYYTLDYVVSQAGYKLGKQSFNENPWNTKYIWNNLSTHFGFSFKLTSLKKKDKK
jgi:hypothetical protein